MSFKKYITEKVKIYRNEKSDDWVKEKEVHSYIKKVGNTICGIGLLEKFFKSRDDKEFIFVYLGKAAKYKEDEFKANNKNKDEELVRYVSRTTLTGGEMPLCILNAAKGYMRFMENIDEDPDLEDAQWSKPEKFNYLRTVY